MDKNTNDGGWTNYHFCSCKGQWKEPRVLKDYLSLLVLKHLYLKIFKAWINDAVNVSKKKLTSMYAYISAYLIYITPIKQNALSHYQHNISWQLVDSSAWCMSVSESQLMYHRCVTGIILKKEQKSKWKMLFCYCLCTFSMRSKYYSASCARSCVINCLTINKIIVMFSLRYGYKHRRALLLCCMGR